MEDSRYPSRAKKGAPIPAETWIDDLFQVGVPTKMGLIEHLQSGMTEMFNQIPKSDQKVTEEQLHSIIN
jgi:hypothetical protein